MISFPNAKINLGLNIIRKRDDGFHDLESVFAPVNWFDILEIIESKEELFYVNGLLQEKADRSNLVLKALDLLKADFELPNLEIRLEKIIPVGAGLGGGSADASFTLCLLNELFALKISKETLKNYAAQLGSDCPFFVDNQMSYVQGRGEVLSNLSDDSLKGTKIVLINPKIHVSTKEAFARVVPKQHSITISTILSEPISRWRELGLRNDFEESVFIAHPEIAEIKALMYKNGASYASMSGSGSTVIGLFEKDYPRIDNDKWIIHYGELL